ncbi:MAG: hypothetical protein OEZ06_21370 [Myxococcales bacterium]|nr:hypothetical protein [Myxococcales bacterium]
MNTRLLIDSIVRQTMVLIAQLSTVQGARSPLSHVADQVFLELTRKLESQGVRRQVVADMFGMALRGVGALLRRHLRAELRGLYPMRGRHGLLRGRSRELSALRHRRGRSGQRSMFAPLPQRRRLQRHRQGAPVLRLGLRARAAGL